MIYNRKGKIMNFNRSHINPEEMEKLLVVGNTVPLKPAQLQSLTDAVREYTHQLLSNDENKCVKKTNIRSSHSQVHVGNNNWESRLDKEVYPNLMNNIANDFGDFIADNYKTKMRDVYKSLVAFIDYMASDGYCSDDEHKRIENLFKTFVKELKLYVFDNSKGLSCRSTTPTSTPTPEPPKIEST